MFLHVAPPSACRDLNVSESSTYNQITVTWNRPAVIGRNDFYYNIYYSSDENEGKFIKHNEDNYYSSSDEVNYTLSGLNPFTSYAIRVTVDNGVSYQDVTGKQNRMCEITTTTSKPTQWFVQV